jgi:hypothetical protein
MAKSRIDDIEGVVIEPSHGHPEQKSPTEPSDDVPERGEGMRGKDKQGALRDTRHGTFDPAGQEVTQPARAESKASKHQRDQPGADVREGDLASGPVPMEDFSIPEGLRRQRMGPYDRDVGREFPPKK